MSNTPRFVVAQFIARGDATNCDYASLFVNQLGLTQSFELCDNKKDMMKLSKTRLSEIESLSEDAIDTSEIPELDDDFWENARRVGPENYLQIDHEILEWFKDQGQDYHEQINTVLRTYMEAHR